MKNLQKFRLISQLIFVVLTGFAFFLNFEIATLVLIILSIIGGSFHCGWICPFGTLQEIISLFGSKLGIKKYKLPKKLHNIFKYTRYILFLLAVIIGLDILMPILSTSPKSNFDFLLMGRFASISGIIVLVFFSIASLFIERPFCNYLCPEGAKYGLYGVARPLTITRDTDKCIDCKLCSKSCPMNIDISSCDNVRSLECINCFKCISACPVNNALKYKFFKRNKSEFMRYILVLVTGIAFAIYLNFSNLSTPQVVIQTEMPSLITNAAILENSINSIDETVVSNDNLESNTSLSDSSTPSSVEVIEDTTADVKAEISEVGISDMTSTVTTNENSKETKTDTVTTETKKQEVPSTTAAQTVETKTVAEIPSNSKYADGIFEGSATGFRGTITVSVTIEKDNISQVEILDYKDDDKWFNRASSSVVSDILNSQTSAVNSVSGATYSSQGIMDAVEDALKKARLN